MPSQYTVQVQKSKEEDEMNKLKNLYWNMVVKAMNAKSNLEESIVAKKEEGASHFVEILVAIIIVIAIAAVFKNQIVNFINNITGQATSEASNLF